MGQTRHEFVAEMLVFLNGLAFLLGLEGHAPWHGLGILCVGLYYLHVTTQTRAACEETGQA